MTNKSAQWIVGLNAVASALEHDAELARYLRNVAAGIVAAAGGEAVPDAWIDQLAYGGRIVAPVAAGPGQQALMVIDKARQGIRQTILEAVNFVPLKSGVA